jgi:formylglycine-generating enzyme required for sulfatase activity
MTGPLPDDLVIELLARLLADRAAGALRPLPEYQALYPGHAEAVAAEHAAVAAGTEPAAPGAGGLDGRRVGPYRLLRELGRGGQGAVWLAHDDRLQRRVALKLVPRSPLVAELAPRFRREAQLAGALDHPGLCAVYDVGHDDALAWMALRYVEGETLAQRLARGALPRAEALRLVESAARALHVAHEAGVLHRDVKPANIMVTPAGEAVLLDFGVARPEGDGPPLTLSGEALGTPAYMAPEQLDGAAGVDRRADVWSLGVTLHEALAGARPFEAATREALVRSIRLDEPPPPPCAGRDLALVLATVLAKEPDRRYRTALDLAEDLRRVREREPPRARRASAPERLWLWARRRPALAASLGALALVVVGALVVTGLLLADTRRALQDVTRLADLKLARDLLAEADELWPAEPARVPDMKTWLSRAREVLEREPLHRATRLVGGAEARAWMREQLDQLLEALPRLEQARAAVAERAAFASDLVRVTVDARAGDWARAAAAVAADARFAGLWLEPQPGLLPLGPDPRSGLEEFALLGTGAPPVRSADGALWLEDTSALVLVLVPGGRTRVGAEPATDPFTAAWDGPVQELVLDPFLVAKFEMTQGQWSVHAGANPALYQAGSKHVALDRPMLHPVESINHPTATRVLAQLGLLLPSEAQWEHAARAGTATPWWTGASPQTLQGAANLADRHAREHGGHVNWPYADWLDDGWTAHAPVGSFAANPWGLHDVAGNVQEWCRDTWEDWARYHPRDGDGLCVGEEIGPSLRGGSFLDAPTEARSGFRNGAAPEQVGSFLGVRPVRGLVR